MLCVSATSKMKLSAIFALLLIWQSSVLASPTINTVAEIDETKFSTRLVATPKNETENRITGNENAVDLARKLLFDFQLFNLMDNVVQAALFNESSHHRLRFEMETALQANEVVQGCFRANGPFRVTQETRDFIDPPTISITTMSPEATFRMGV